MAENNLQNKGTINEKQESSNNIYKMTILIMTCVIVFVFIILPVVFILLANVFPNSISSDGALLQLMNNVNSLVGYCSLLVGVFSIYYAYQSNKLLDKHQEKHEEFLREISEKVRDIEAGNSKIYDQIVNKQESNTPKKDNSK